MEVLTDYSIEYAMNICSVVPNYYIGIAFRDWGSCMSHLTGGANFTLTVNEETTLYCIKKWNGNRDRLEEKLRNGTTWNECSYSDLVKLVVKEVLNGGSSDDSFSPEPTWDYDHITMIDDGDYQGTLLFLIPRDTYQPAESDYLMTYVWYGSCSGCDTLQAIQMCSDEILTDEQVKDFMALCKDIITNMILPYNTGWRHSEEFEPCEIQKERWL